MKYLAYQTLQSNGTKGDTTTTNGSDKMLPTVTTVLSVTHVSQVEHVIIQWTVHSHCHITTVYILH